MNSRKENEREGRQFFKSSVFSSKVPTKSLFLFWGFFLTVNGLTLENGDGEEILLLVPPPYFFCCYLMDFPNNRTIFSFFFFFLRREFTRSFFPRGCWMLFPEIEDLILIFFSFWLFLLGLRVPQRK